MPRSIKDYPWEALEHLGRREVRVCRGVRRRLERAVRLEGWASGLGELLAADTDAVVHGVQLTDVAPERGVTLYFRLSPGGARLAFTADAELGVVLLSRLLGQAWRLSRTDPPFDPMLRGALSSLVIEAARRTGTDSALSACDPWVASELILVELTLLLDGRPYSVFGWSDARESVAPVSSARGLDQLGWLPVSLPIVIGQSLCLPGLLQLLEPGDAWIPGEPLWLDSEVLLAAPPERELQGHALLAAPGSDRGMRVRLSSGSAQVTHTVAALPLDTAGIDQPPARAADLTPPFGEPRSSARHGQQHSPSSFEHGASGPALLPTEDPMSDKLNHPALDAPLVVRVELGAVTLSAREWAELEAGDVLETSGRINDPVVLRCAGREIARGELVDVEGQVGVRITQLVTGDTQA